MREKTFCSLLVVAVALGGLAAASGAKQPASSPTKAQVEVTGVLATDDESFVVVLRTSGEPVRYLPIWIGEMEALAIQMRIDEEEPPRPLTLNLLESVLDSGDIDVVDIAIHDLSDGVFIGSVQLERNGHSWTIDARPSDAIGLAVGSKAPIWVSQDVLDDAALDPDDLLEEGPPSSKEKGGDDGKINYEETL